MTNRSDPRARGEFGVLEAWRILLAPVPGPHGGAYAGVVLVIALLNVSAIAAIGGAVTPDPVLATVFALIHVALVPGILLAMVVIPTDELDFVEWLILAAGFGVLLVILSGLVLALLTVRLTPLTIVGWTALLSLALGAVAFRRGLSWSPPDAPARPTVWAAVTVLLVAAALRLPTLGYSEFQGDETEVILRAVGVVQALPDALFYHGKGPGEVVAVAMLSGLIGRIAEGAARLPFALAGVLGVVAFYALARRLLGTPGGLAAGLLLALDGYFLAFSRITQYQSLVLLLGTLAIWCALRWSQGGHDRWATLASVLAAMAALAHYDAVFVLPPIGLAVLWRTRRGGLLTRDTLAAWGWGSAIGAAILLAFFGSYAASPLFGLATGRIEDRVGAGFPHNNLSAILQSGTLYLGTVFPLLLLTLMLVGAALLVVRRTAATPPRVWLLGLVWAAVPFLFYAFVARKPGTHIHVALSGLVLLAGTGFGGLWQIAGTSRALLVPLGAVLAAGLVLVGTYLVPIYLQPTAELVRLGRVGSLPLTWRPPGGLPAKERFGFPYQAGWKAIGALYADGTLSGSYETNEQPQVSHWYTGGAWRCSAEPRYFMIAEGVQDEIETPRRTIQAEYHQIGTVTVAGEPKLRVYERGTGTGARAVTWPVEETGRAFERRPGSPSLDPGVWARGAVAPGSTHLAVRYGDAIALLGYQVFAEDPRPGGVVRVDLFWLPRVTSNEGHRIDVQLGREQWIGDGSGPACDKTGDDRNWAAGRPFVQRLSIPIAGSAAAGSYPLLVSVSELGDRGGALPPSGAAGSDPQVEVGQIEVRGDSNPVR